MYSLFKKNVECQLDMFDKAVLPASVTFQFRGLVFWKFSCLRKIILAVLQDDVKSKAAHTK